MYYGYSYGLNHVSRGTAVDPDAQAFITAASITDATQQSAVNQLVLDLKAASIWTKMVRLYPFVGGTADKHKYCLKSLDAGSFSGGVTHSSNGVAFGGVNGYLNTNLNANTLTNNSTHLSFYSRSTTTTSLWDVGCENGANRFAFGYYGATIYLDQYDTGVGRSSASVSPTTKLFVMSRTASNVGKGYRDGTSFVTDTDTISSVLPNATLWVGGLNGAGLYSSREYAFASAGAGLSDADVTALNTAVNTFQTTLSRNV